jgi:hypothetical protein
MRSDQEILEIVNATPAITAVRMSAAQQSVSVHLSGRALRDLFLGLPPQNFDFIVEGRAGDLARQVAAGVPGGAIRVDADSGAVHYNGRELGNLHFLPANGLSPEQFLTRHSDFTVNTLLFDLKGDRFVDGHGAFADIEGQTIRRLPSADSAAKPAHWGFRAIRTALLTPTFTLAAETRADIEAHRQVLATADAAAIGYEINSILKSAEYPRGITLMSELGLLQRVFTSFFPFAAASAATDGLLHGNADTGEAAQLARLLDEVTTPCQELVARHLPVMRLVILLTTAIRRCGLNIAGDDGRRFLVTQGDRLERACNDLSSRFSSPGVYAFRVRMLTTGYWRGLASLAEDTVSLEEAIASSMSTFGRPKGLLCGLLMGADWLLHKSDDRGAVRRTDQVKDIVLRLTTHGAVTTPATRSKPAHEAGHGQ